MASFSGLEAGLSSGRSVTSLQVILNKNFHLLSPSSSWQAGRAYFSPSPIVGIISRLRLQFHTAVSQSRCLGVAKAPLTRNQKCPERRQLWCQTAWRRLSERCQAKAVWSELDRKRQHCCKYGHMRFHFTWPTVVSSGRIHDWSFLFVKHNIDTKTSENSFPLFFLLLFIRRLQALCVITLFIAISHSVSRNLNKHSEH